MTRREIDALITRFRATGGKGRRIARRIERLGAKATRALCAAYDSPEEHFRWEIVNLLGYTRDARAIPLLADRGIHDPELHPRWRSIWALTSVDDGTVPDILRRQIRCQRGIRRRNAAVALSLYRDPAALPVLRLGLSSRNDWIRWETVSCLVGYADTTSASRILGLYGAEKDTSVRREMVRAFNGVRTRQAEGFLIRRLVDRDPGVRTAAAHAVVANFGARAGALLRRRLRSEQDSHVRREIRIALRGG